MSYPHFEADPSGPSSHSYEKLPNQGVTPSAIYVKSHPRPVVDAAKTANGENFSFTTRTVNDALHIERKRSGKASREARTNHLAPTNCFVRRLQHWVQTLIIAAKQIHTPSNSTCNGTALDPPIRRPDGVREQSRSFAASSRSLWRTRPNSLARI